MYRRISGGIMVSEKLKQAREFEQNYNKKEHVDDRPIFHATGTVGWINDPNGFSLYKGRYHLFYQYYPYDTHWGPMHWGHSVSDDLITWEQLPCALAPDEDYDRDGCFSGSAIELPDGLQLLMYTGVKRVENADGKTEDFQQQCIAIGDGIDYEKIDTNPVISKSLIPTGDDIHDFRDPKIIKNKEKYYCLTINRSADDSGQILVYESEDAIDWQFKKVLDKSENHVGKVWECPDYFNLGDKKILLISPQEMEGDGENIFPGYNNLFLIGKGQDFLDFNRESIQPIDLGTDFYAAQTIETLDGRRVMIAWMQNWETCNYGNDLHDYYSFMTIPRELTLIDGHVMQQPVKEIENYYSSKVEHRDVKLKESDGEITLEGIAGRVFDMTIDVRSENEDDYIFSIALAKDNLHETRIIYDSRRGVVKLDRTKSGMRFSSLSTREFRISRQPVKLRILLDKYAMELFVNDGMYAATMKIDTDIKADKITFSSDRQMAMDVIKYDLESPIHG